MANHKQLYIEKMLAIYNRVLEKYPEKLKKCTINTITPDFQIYTNLDDKFLLIDFTYRNISVRFIRSKNELEFEFNSYYDWKTFELSNWFDDIEEEVK